jgi:uncharacterized protein YbjT (DUF2867 family)
MRITVFGATGLTGRYILAEGLRLRRPFVQRPSAGGLRHAARPAG